MSKNKVQGDYTHIKLSQVVSTAKMRLRIEDGESDIFLARYANEGARHFDSLNTFLKKDCELEVVNGKAKLPNGFYQMLSISTCDGGNMLYVDMPFLTSCNFAINSNFINVHGIFQIQDGWIYTTIGADFSANHGTSVTGTTTVPNCPPSNATNVQNGPVSILHKIRISYISMNVDDDGMMVVYGDMERGLVAYCVWMYMLDSASGKYTAQQIQANEQIWINQKKWYQSIQFQNNFRNTRRQVAAMVNSWIVQKDWYI